MDFDKLNRDQEASSWEQERQERTKGSKAVNNLLDEGVYRGRIIGHTLGITVNGKEYFSLVVKLNEEEKELFQFADMPVPATREVRIWLSTTGAIERAITTLIYLGYTRNNLEGLDERSENAHPFIGQVLTVRVKHGDYLDQPKEEIEVLRRPKEVTAEERKEISDKKAPQFASLMATKLAKAAS